MNVTSGTARQTAPFTLLAQQWEGVPDRGAGGTGGVAAGISRDALHAAGVL